MKKEYKILMVIVAALAIALTATILIFNPGLIKLSPLPTDTCTTSNKNQIVCIGGGERAQCTVLPGLTNGVWDWITACATTACSNGVCGGAIQPYCGDGICNNGETCTYCPNDCGSCQSTCTSWTYSSWTTCSSYGTQTRTVTSSSPSGCTGGSPVTLQSCTSPVGPTNIIQNSAPTVSVSGSTVSVTVYLKNTGGDMNSKNLVELQPRAATLSWIGGQTACNTLYPNNIHKEFLLSYGETASITLSESLNTGTYDLYLVSADTCCASATNPNLPCSAASPYSFGTFVQRVTIQGSTPVCGDGQCAGTETRGTCPADCAGYCGDGYCDTAKGESSSWCNDCSGPVCPSACVYGCVAGTTTCNSGPTCTEGTYQYTSCPGGSQIPSYICTGGQWVGLTPVCPNIHCNNDGVCNPGETKTNCANDCVASCSAQTCTPYIMQCSGDSCQPNWMNDGIIIVAVILLAAGIIYWRKS